MKERKRNYSFRMSERLGEEVQAQARDNRRTVSAEIGLLIEQGMEWRKEHGNTVPKLPQS